MDAEFIPRIHKTGFETDSFKLLGKTSFQKHTSDFERIDWEKDYWTEFKSGNFNMPDLEVLNKEDSKYLSISTSPNTEDTFQFIIGLGTHQESNHSNEPKRKVKLYMTESENNEVPKKFIALFFKRDFNQIQKELDKLALMEEIEDKYINIK